MNKMEAKKIIASIMAIYPNYNVIDIDLSADMWAETMDEYNYSQVSTALKSYAKSDGSGFAPTPGKLIEIIHTFTKKTELNEQEAWGMVRKAISNSTYHYLEEFAKLPKVVQEAVGMPENLRFIAIDENYDEEVTSSNFMRNYRSVVKRHYKISKMPESVQEKIREVNKGTPKGILQKNREEVRERIKPDFLLDQREDTRPFGDKEFQKLSKAGLI